MLMKYIQIIDIELYERQDTAQMEVRIEKHN